jgi:hypothetical protein
MYAGAVVSLIALGANLADKGAIRTAVEKAQPSASAATINNAVNFGLVVAVVGGLIAIGLWLWIAWATLKGRGWARITGTVFFGIGTLDLVVGVSSAGPAITKALAAAVWLVGLGAVVFLWRGESSAFFNPPYQGTFG